MRPTAEAFAADLRFYAGERGAAGPLGRRVHYLPGWEVPPFEPLSPTREIARRARRGALPPPADAAIRCRDAPSRRSASAACPAPSSPTRSPTSSRARRWRPTPSPTRLVEWGYHRVPLVQDPGDLALRGGILDVFPAGYSRPLRLEFVGDDVERMREFDPESQRSLERVEEALLLPVQELGRSRLGAAGRAAGRRARRRDRPGAPGAPRAGRGGPQRPRRAGHRVPAAVSLRRPRHARRLPARRHRLLDAGRAVRSTPRSRPPGRR